MSTDVTKRAPEGIDVNWVADQVGWSIPTWIAKELYHTEFSTGETGQMIVDLFNNLGSKIGKSMATGAGDAAVIKFKYWRKLNDKATKMKPVFLTASLFEHPEYEKTWLLIDYDT